MDEDRFTALVDSLAAAGDTAALTDLLREDHEFYDQRSAAAVVRMRGWILLTLAHIGLPPAALIFALEELDAGHDGYLVAAAARALRSSRPRPEFAPFVLRAAGNLRYRDEAIALDSYGAYADAAHTTTAMRELLATLAWLGPLGRSALPRLEELSRLHWDERGVVDRAVEPLEDGTGSAAEKQLSAVAARGRTASPALATLASLGLALFPKCPICWATYLSALGISSLVRIPYTPWLEPVLFVMMVLNVASVWWRCRSIGRMAGAHLASAGALAIVGAKLLLLPDQAVLAGALLTVAGSAASVWKRQERGPMLKGTPSSSAVGM